MRQHSDEVTLQLLLLLLSEELIDYLTVQCRMRQSSLIIVYHSRDVDQLIISTTKALVTTMKAHAMVLHLSVHSSLHIMLNNWDWTDSWCIAIPIFSARIEGSHGFLAPTRSAL